MNKIVERWIDGRSYDGSFKAMDELVDVSDLW